MEFHELRPGDRHGELVSLFREHGFALKFASRWWNITSCDSASFGPGAKLWSAAIDRRFLFFVTL